MTNQYYIAAPDAQPGTTVRSAQYNDNNDSLQQGFELLPDPALLFTNAQNFAVATSPSVNQYVVELRPNIITTLADGYQISVRVPTANTGPAQLNLNDLGVVEIRTPMNVSLQAGDIAANAVLNLTYNEALNFWQIDSSLTAVSGAAERAEIAAANAQESETNAAASALAASTSETNAANSAADAALSEAAAVDARDQIVGIAELPVIIWQPGLIATAPAQRYLFEGNFYIAPTASTSNPITLDASPVADPLWISWADPVRFVKFTATATAGQSVFNVGTSFDSIADVFVNTALQEESAYTLDNVAGTITLNEGLPEGTFVQIWVGRFRDAIIAEFEGIQEAAETAQTSATASAAAALASETAAAASEAAAAVSQANAAASETSVEAFRDQAEQSATDAANSATSSNTDANRAALSASAAQTAETGAASSASAAAASETAAASSAASAAASDLSSAGHDSAAATAALGAATSETNARNSATAAANSQLAASNSETNALNASAAAAVSASSALSSANGAGDSASQASGFAAAASTSATQADGAASSASSSAGDAAASALAAETSETNAAASASTASQAATNAAVSESNAAGSATAASQSAGNAATSETNASASEAGAANSATSAMNSATAAQTSATAASSSATGASNSADAAEASATAADNSANAAAASETNATTSASNAATSETNAATSETNAANSATTATNQAATAGTSATAAQTAEAAATNSATAAANSATNAANSATAAASSASSAATSATNAADSATAADNSADAASTSETNAATSASNAATSETNAANSATTATNQASAAATSAGTAMTQAANAATSATEAGNQVVAATTQANNAAASAVTAANEATDAAASAAEAAASAGQTFVAGGVFTPTVGTQYPNVVGVTVNTLFIVSLASAEATFTWTTGDLNGLTASSADTILYDPDTSEFSLIINGAAGSVTSVNGLTGTVVLTPSDVGALPNTATVNGLALSGNPTLTATTVGAVPNTAMVNGQLVTSNPTITLASLGGLPNTATINGELVSSNPTLDFSDVGALPDTTMVNGVLLSTNPNFIASATARGMVELATGTETATGTDTTRAVTPASLTSRTATTSRTGLIEIATNTETATGTDTTRAATPAGVAAAINNIEADDVNAVPDTATVNGLLLTSNPTITLASLGGLPNNATINGVLVSSNPTLDFDDVGALPNTAMVNGVLLSTNPSFIASTTTRGMVELATGSETATGTDIARAVTPSSLTARTATTSRTGLIEIATNTETVTGTDTNRATTPAGVSAAIATITAADVGALTQTTADGRYLARLANAVSASRWANARTVTLTGDVTGTASFDGSANFSITATVANNSHAHTIGNISGLQAALDEKLDTTGGTFSGNVGIETAGQGTFRVDAGTNQNAEVILSEDSRNHGAYFRYLGADSNETVLGTRNGGVETNFMTVARGSTSVSFPGIVRISGTQRAFADNYHPNADRWTTARTLTLTGDVTGSVSITGASNVSLTATVANNSHGHAISNVTGLQPALDARLLNTATVNGVLVSSNPNFIAATNARGMVELATNAETQAGTDTTRAVTPASLRAETSQSATGNRIARRNSSGDLSARFFNSTSGDSTPGATPRFAYRDSGSQTLRFMTIANAVDRLNIGTTHYYPGPITTPTTVFSPGIPFTRAMVVAGGVPQRVNSAFTISQSGGNGVITFNEPIPIGTEVFAELS